MIKKITVLTPLLLILLLSQNNLFAAESSTITKTTSIKQEYQSQLISKDAVYKDEFENLYKIGYKIKIKNSGKKTWLSEGIDQIVLKSKNDKTKQFPIFLNKNVNVGESVEFKIIFETNKITNIYTDYLYLSKNGKEISGSGINVNINLENIKNKLPSDKLLDIQPIEQIYTLNCESASLQMGLSYFDINKTQDELLQETGFTTKLPPEKIGNRIVWGDPEKGYVGNYNGLYSDYCSNQTGDTSIRTLKCATGWGVNNGPIAKNAKRYLKNSYDLDNASIIDLKNELASGNPIVFWEVPDDRKPEENINIYTYYDWEKIKYVRTHVVLLVGYANISDDTIYTFNDPANGLRTQMSEDDMMRVWERYDNNIVVLKK